MIPQSTTRLSGFRVRRSTIFRCSECSIGSHSDEFSANTRLLRYATIARQHLSFGCTDATAWHPRHLPDTASDSAAARLRPVHAPRPRFGRGHLGGRAAGAGEVGGVAPLGTCLTPVATSVIPSGTRLVPAAMSLVPPGTTVVARSTARTAPGWQPRTRRTPRSPDAARRLPLRPRLRASA